MQEIMDLERDRKQQLVAHPFFDWMRSSQKAPEDRLLIAPVMAVFAMNFRDTNRWFIRYPEPRSELEEIINRNTREDETHSRLYLLDWRKLHLDEKLGWRASDTLWWLFLAPDTEPFRRYVMTFARMTVADGADPLIRFAHLDAVEACGNAFLSTVAPVASQAEAKNGIKYPYFGPHHLAREAGHVLESAGVFERRTLDGRQRPRALALAGEMFDLFMEMHDGFLRYAERYVERGAFPRRPESAPAKVRSHSADADGRYEVEGEETLPPSHAEIMRVLLERKAQTARHPFYAWIHRNNGLSPRQKLQRFIPMWIGDIMGYRELNRYAIRYPTIRSSGEAVINAWCDDLETHNSLFLNDWVGLGMDEALGWTASDTLKFCFLDPQVDVHRRNMCTFVKLAMGHAAPALRFWLLQALEASGHAFFENVKQLALPVEQEDGVRLDYLGDRHDVLHPVKASRANGKAVILSEPLSPADQDTAMGMVETIFDAVDEQLTLSLDVAQSNKFGLD
ncbi:MAG: hypothetical protein QM820_38800 [Minicystis sp.]